MTRILPIAALLLVAACGQQEPPPAATNDEGAAAETSEAAEAVPELAGQWNVTAVDGRPVDAGSALTAAFAGSNASISAGCVRRAFAYTQRRNIVSFTANPSGSSNCEGRGTSAEQETAAVALQQASIVIFTKDGSEANLSGNGGNLALRRR